MGSGGGWPGTGSGGIRIGMWANRLATTAILLFWLSSTAWLAWTSWMSGTGRFEAIGTGEPLRAFFQWNDTADLVILGNGARIGQLSIGGFEGFDPRSGRETRGVTSSGTIDQPERGDEALAGWEGVTWRWNAGFSESMDLRHFEGVFRAPRQDLSVRLEVSGEPPELGARVQAGGQVLFETGTLSVAAEEDAGGPGRRPGRGSVGVGGGNRRTGAGEIAPLVAGLSSTGGGAEAWLPRVEAARGMLRAAGREWSVYVLSVSLGPGDMLPPIRLFLSEAGEPIRIETGWGVEALAEVLIPLQDRRE